MVRKVSYKEFEKIYKGKIKRDFPPLETRPLSAIKKLFDKDMYFCLVMTDQTGNTDAYACFLKSEKTTSVLLDYYAVEPQKRGTGIGSKFIKEIVKNVDCDGILIESEMPSKAKSRDDKIIRERRIAFYQNNGARLSKYGWRAFCVDYNLLWLPVKKELCDRNIGKEILSIYSQYTPWWSKGEKVFRYYEFT